MHSINTQRIRERVANIYDMAHTQSTFKSLQEYVKTLEQGVDIHTERAGTPGDFAKDFGAGL